MKRFTCFETMAVLVLVAEIAHAQTTTRVSVDSGEVQGDGNSTFASISGDGRYVAFASAASNLVTGDTNGHFDIFVRDRIAGTTERVSVGAGGEQGNNYSYYRPSISADGRYVAFHSLATNLVNSDTNGHADIFVRDRESGTTERVSVDSSGGQANDQSLDPSISSDGRFVAFRSGASNLVPGDANVQADIFVHDRQLGTTALVSVTSAQVQANGPSLYPSISADGRFVAFESHASNLVPADTNISADIFLRDCQSGTTHIMSIDTSDIRGNGDSLLPAISANGRFVVFHSVATNLGPQADLNGNSDVFLRDINNDFTELVSISSNWATANNASYEASVSADGRFVAFTTFASNLVSGDTNGVFDVCVRDRGQSTTERISVDSDGFEGSGASYGASVSGNGYAVAFYSEGDNLVRADTNTYSDVFVRRGGTFITAFCFGDGAGAACPCDNTGQTGRGCDNSIITGGALLIGGGGAFLSDDTLVLTSSYERPTAFSLFWQAGSEVPARVFGDGLGCMGPPLKRMYWHNAVGGVVTVPQGADLSISVRSATLGDTIAPGTTRGYYVFYRDPTPTFCPPPFGSTFNTTNGLRVLWGG